MEERKKLREGKVKIIQPFLIYGANRQTRRSQLRQVYKEGFTSWEEAKRTVRIEDQKKLKNFSNFAVFLKNRIKEIQDEFQANGETITEERAFEIIKERAKAEEDFAIQSADEEEKLKGGKNSFLFRGKSADGSDAEQLI